ncbi:MAG: 4-hydroxythreonine-4-phosphate dehydrogenase PdxA [Minwuiales bacterium]|nr:4-hydroxythreonine-4-phosphate dehydrogenase PdxA [Minwuiales bacterium]
MAEGAGRPAPIAVTMGEPAGIGGELTLQAWSQRDAERLPGFFVLDDPARLDRLAKTLGMAVPIAEIGEPAAAADAFATSLPVLPLDHAIAASPGRPAAADAPHVLAAIERAVEFCRQGDTAAMVTNPINKKVLYEAGFDHPGHTEYLAALCGGSDRPVMLLAAEGIRVVPVTVHVPLSQVAGDLTTDLIVETAAITAEALCKDFGIDKPRLAVAGLNPHAGENGALGREEIEVIEPALDILRGRGIALTGPMPADTLFHAAARRTYDAAICMYHDQALIPLKTIDFDGGVNITLGLPIVRTSPDHGTAFDIAGTGRANPASLIAAIKRAAEIAANRSAFERAA